MRDFIDFALHDGAFYTFALFAIILWALYGAYIRRVLKTPTKED